MKSYRVFVLFSLSLYFGCAPNSTSSTKDISLKYRNAETGIIYGNESLVFFKNCTKNTVSSGKDCYPTNEEFALPWGEYLRAAHIHIGPELENYGGIHAEARLKEELSLNQKRMNENIPPSELDATRARILELERMIWKVDQVKSIVSAIKSNTVFPYLQNDNELFEVAVAPFLDERSVWVDKIGGLIWHDGQFAKMNWFDSAEERRQDGVLTSPQRLHFGSSCKERLGAEWRLPTLAEARASYARGLRSSKAGRNIRSFWTSDLEHTGRETYAYVMDFSLRGAVQKPRWDRNEVLCVTSATTNQ